MSAGDSRPIGVFDSGVGGLTVLGAARERLPAEHFIYLGDTARLPYGIKSPATILSYARRAAACLADAGIKLLVVACNTASAVALAEVARDLAPLPVIGVVKPGAEAAVAARRGARHLVLATEATVRLHAYRDAIRTLDSAARVDELACELMVALAEEGWTDDEIATAVVRRYLEPAFEAGPPDSLVLGCTHFPLLAATVRKVAGRGVPVVDSASTTAAVVAHRLAGDRLAAPAGAGSVRLMATDGPTRFARVGGRFLGEALSADDIELVDL